MDGQFICNVLENDRYTKLYFHGMGNIDEYPLVPPERPCFFVFNTDVSDGPGEHWVVMYLQSNKMGEFFDSFGRSPVECNLDSFFKFHTEYKITYNNKLIQHIASSACGFHCLFFALMRCRGHSLSNIVQMYSSDTVWNDKTVKKLILKNFGNLKQE